MKAEEKTVNEGREQRSGPGLNGALSLTLSAIILKVLGLIYKIPLSALLGDEGMGYFNSAYTIFSLFYLLCTAGVPKAITMLTAESIAKGSGKLERKIVSVSIIAFLFISTLSTIALTLFSGQLAEFIGSANSRATIIAIAPSIIPVALSGVIRGRLTARLKLGAVAVSQILDGVGKLAFGLILAIYASKLGFSAPIISAFTILGVSIGALFSLLFLCIASKTLKRDDKKEQNIIIPNNRNILKRVLSISFPITLASCVMSLGGLIDLSMTMRQLVAIGYTEEQATAYYGNYTTLAVPMYNLAISLISPISIALLPIIAGHYIKGEYSKFNSCIRTAISSSAFICAPLVIGIFAYSEEILKLLFRGSDISVGAPLLCLLIPSASIMSLLLIVNSVLEAKGRYSVPLISMLVGSVFKIIFGYYFISNESFGIAGAPIGTLISYVISLSISLIALGRDKNINMPIFSCSIIPYLNAFISIISSRGILHSCLKDVNESISLIICICISAVIYFIMSFISGVFSRLKKGYMSKYTKKYERIH